jgi:hypothetical protein
MTFQFPKPFFGGLFVGADAFDSESLAVRNTFGAMFRMTTLWGQVLMFICRFDHANNVHPTIKFNHETSRNNISFLDTYTTCENGIMSTDIYNKPTDKHQYLSPQSCHPKHCTNNG